MLQFINQSPKVVKIWMMSFQQSLNLHHFEQEKDSSPLNILWDSRQVEALELVELVSLSARVTSIKSATTSLSELLSDRDRDP